MKKLSILFLLIVMSGCAGTTSIQQILEDRKSPLMYLHDTVPVPEKKAGTISIGQFIVADVLPPTTVVTNKSSSIVPLLVYNTWSQEDQARLGYAQLENDYKQFFRDSFIEEIRRSGGYAYKTDSGDLVLEITVHKLEMSAPINQRGFFFFALIVFGGGNQTSIGPVDVVISADVKATKNGSVVLDKKLAGRFRTAVFTAKGNAILQDYTVAMIEGVSMAVKNLNEIIVQEINKS